MSKTKKADIYLKVVSVAYVKETEAHTDPMVGEILIKVQTDVGEDLFGFRFMDLQTVDAAMNSLHRIRTTMTSQEKVHPKLKGPTDGSTH